MKKILHYARLDTDVSGYFLEFNPETRAIYSTNETGDYSVRVGVLSGSNNSIVFAENYMPTPTGLRNVAALIEKIQQEATK